MSARTHVCVALLLATFSMTGCLFGGGDKKHAPQAARPDVIDSGDDGLPAEATSPADPGSLVSRMPEVSAAARTQQAIGAAQVADAAVARALSPDAPSAVKWVDSESLRLSNAEPAGEGSAADPAESEFVVAGGPDRADELDPVASPERTTSGTDAAPVLGGADPVAPSQVVSNQSLEVSESAVPAASAADAEPAPAALASGAAGGAGELQRRFAQRLRDNPGDLATHLDFQLLRFLSDEPVPDLGAMESLPGEDREVLMALLDGLSNFRNGIRADSNMLLSKKIRPLLEMALRVRSQADLSIKTIALCEEVEAFGSYAPIHGRFVAGAKNEVIVYCELGNVSSRQNDDGEWESTPAQEAVLYTEGGQRMWSSTRQSAPDVSRSRRQDFFVAQQIMLPSNLGIGRYILKVTVYDEQVKRMAEASVPIEIVAQLPPQDRRLSAPKRAPSRQQQPSLQDEVERPAEGGRPARPAPGGAGPVVRKPTRRQLDEPADDRDSARPAAERLRDQALDALSGSRDGDDQ